MENIISIIIGFISLIIAGRSLKQSNTNHKEIVKLQKYTNTEKNLKEYKTEYYRIFKNCKIIFKEIPSISDRIGLLLHKHSQDKSHYLNHIYSELENEIVVALSNDINYFTTSPTKLIQILSSLKSIDFCKNDIFNLNVKNKVDYIYKVTNLSKMKQLKEEYIPLLNELVEYASKNMKIINSNITDIKDMLKKAEIEKIILDNDLKKRYTSTLNLLKYLESFSHYTIKESSNSNSRTTLEYLIVMGSYIAIIEYLKANVIME